MYLRAYQEADFEAIYLLDRVCFASRFRFSRAMMRQVVEAPGAVVLVAFEEDVLAGFCAVGVEGYAGKRWGYVATLDVAPEYRGCGVGRMLMSEAESAVVLAGGGAMLLHVWVENEAAVRLYEGLGYARAGRDRGFYGGGFDAWSYRKSLDLALVGREVPG